MSYRPVLNTRDRGGAIAAVVAIHIGLLFMLLNLAGALGTPEAQSVLRVIELAQPPPPPPPPEPQHKPQPKPKEKEGGSAPPNIRSQATPVQAPKPRVIVPPLPQIAASATPRHGTAATQGASNLPGPGTGAGGSGNGTGNGNGGNGPGGGGDNGVAEPPHLVTPVLTGRDLPSGLLDEWPRGATVFMRLRIDPRGYVSECTIDRGTGVAAIDSILCNLAHDRLRFRPALNRAGQAVAGWAGYAQPPPR